MNVAYLCLGGNLGNRESIILKAISEISTQVGNVMSRSSIYETEAWGVKNQQSYLNSCIKIETELNAPQLLHALLLIESKMGRERNAENQYQERTIDIDILFFNNAIINITELIVPHPRMHLRKFVLTPLCQIAPNYKHPILNKMITELLNECGDILEVKLFTL